MEKEMSYELKELLKFKVEVKDCIDPDLMKEEKEQQKLRLHKTNRWLVPKKNAAKKRKSWSWNRIRSRPNTKHGYH